MNEVRPPKDNARRLQAKLKWEAACERLAFVLRPPDADAGADAPDLASSIRLAAAALEELQLAFAAEEPPSSS